jgi:hypothetical protein
MARQKGAIGLSGKLGDLEFFSRNGKFHVRKAREFDINKFRNDIAFKRVRENISEFRTVATAAKFLRAQLDVMVKKVKDPSQNQRIRNALRRVLKSDTSHPRGMRTVADGDLNLLKGFELSAPGTLKQSYWGSFSTEINRQTGILTVTIPEIVPEKFIQLAAGSTHFQFHCAAFEWDYASDQPVYAVASSDKRVVNNEPVQPILLKAEITPNSTKPLLLLFGIDFHQFENNAFYEMMNRANNGVILADLSVQ